MWQAQEFARGVGRTLRSLHDEATQERLPERWVELIHYLNNKERREERARQRKAQSGELNAVLAREITGTKKKGPI
jgi:hypothetical protein